MSQSTKIMLATIIGTFMVILDQTIVNIALPHIITVFNETADRAQLVISAYIMANAVSVPLAAYLSKKFGVKWIFLLSQAGFLLGSVLCGISWNLESLIAFRVIQGLCGGLLSPVAMTMLFTAVPAEKRGSAMATFGISFMLAPALGPSLGGWLVDQFSWRWVFYVNVPIVITAITLGWLWVHDTARSEVHFDLKGFLMAAIGFSTLLFALSYAPTWGWGDNRILILFAIAVVSITGWIMLELRAKIPLLDLHVFKFRGYSLATGINFITTIALFSVEFLFPVFMQNLKGLPAFNTGLLLIPAAVGSALTMPISGLLYDRTGPKIPAVTGLIITGIATLMYNNLDVTTANSTIVMILFVRGMGIGLSMMPVMTYALSSVPQQYTMQVSSLTTVTRTIFASLGTALFASMLDTFQKHYLGTLVQYATPDSIQAMQVMSTVQVAAMKSGMTLDAAHQLGLYTLFANVTEKASVMSFQSVYVTSGILITLAALPALTLPFIRKTGVKSTKAFEMMG